MRENDEHKRKEATRFKSGLTLRTILALLLSSAIFMPVGAYLAMTSGAGLAGAHAYIVLILFIEIASIVGSPLTKQELFLILVMMQVGTIDMFNFIYRQYLVTSPIGWSFIDPYTKKPVPEVIPSFYAPNWKYVEFSRTYLSSVWLLPVLLTVTMTVLSVLAEMSLTIICSQLYIATEKLPFPLAEIPGELVSTLADRRSKKMEVFTIAMLAGSIYSFLLYGVRGIALGLWNINLQLIPVPWIDLTTGLFGVEKYLPGAALGIATDPIAWVSGFLIPFPVLVYMLVASIFTWVIGNHLALTVFSNVFPDWKSEWTYGMTMSLVWQRSTLRVWIMPMIGVTLAIAVLTLIKHRRAIVRGLLSLWKITGIERLPGLPSLPFVLTVYFSSTIASVLIFKYFIPEFPLIPALVVSVVFSFINAVIGTRSLGETGVGVSIPYIWPATIFLTGYEKIDAWFLSPVIAGSTTPSWVQTIKVAQLTETKLTDFFYAYIFAFLFDLIFATIYANLFWAIAPIPSTTYPYTLVSWPVTVINQLVWATRQIFNVNLNVGLFFFVLTVIVGALGDLAQSRLSIPFSLMGLVAGMSSLPAFTIPLFMSGFVSNFVLSRVFGKERWNQNKAVIVAGIATGNGIIIGVITVLTLLVKIGWSLPF
ncbi:MAG: hypothetical protein ACP5KW_08245 [Thermoproteota archaeon]